MKKGQAAMEFLMTYGWAIIVVLITIGALAYFGVLSPERIFGSSCILEPGLNCEDFRVAYTGGVEPEVTLIIGNSLGVDITNVEVSLAVDLPEGINCNSVIDNDGINDGGSETYTFDCGEIEEDTLFKATINFKYKKSGFTLIRTAIGSISAGVEGSGIIDGGGNCIDNDNDGYGQNCPSGEDCDDTNNNINPGAQELCDDTLDNDCDGIIDEDCSQTIILGENSINTYLNIQDNPIRGDLPGQNLNYGASPIAVTGGAWLARILIKPTGIASALGPGKVITSAKLNIYATSQAGQSIEVYRILRDWGEGVGTGSAAQNGESSWEYYSSPNIWETAGANGAQDRSQIEEATLTLTAGWNSFDITNAVTKWYTGEWTEQGLILIQPPGSGSPQFTTSEGLDSNRPYLEIDYYVPG